MTKYVHEILPGVYIGNGTIGPTTNINDAHLYNYVRSAMQSSAWYHFGGKILPVQVSVCVTGEAEAETEPNSDWAVEDLKKQFEEE